MNAEINHRQKLDLVEQVDTLSEEVKMLALNLAIYLAKAKADSERFNELEPDFIRLVNGTVNVVQEIGRIVNAARNLKTMIYSVPSGRINQDQIEVRLRSILDQCGRIMTSLSRTRDVDIG